jgi:hypothetical protein
MQTIAERKMLAMKVESMRKLEAMKSPEDLLKEDSFGEKVVKFLGMDLVSSEAKLVRMDAQIAALSNIDYAPWRIFVSFNKEDEQRLCLSELATADFKYLNHNNWLNLEEDKNVDLFHGEVLDVSEAPEPTDVIYDHTHRSKTEVYVRLCISYFITACAIFVVSLTITQLQNVKGSLAQLLVALFISMMNAGLPVGIRMLTQIVEAHSSETGSQRSVLTKLIIARCMNSAVLIYVLTPWIEQFSLENMRQIQTILLSDALLAPAMRFMNVWDVFKRNCLAPVVFGKTQAGYNSQFQGTKWTLAERYTDALKSVFAGFFFAVPLPTGLFISAFTMMSTYLVDKYSLMRVWERKPTIDHSLAKLSRYFLITTLWTHLFISMKYFANWPYSYAGLSKELSCDENCVLDEPSCDAEGGMNCDECPKSGDQATCNFFFIFCAPSRENMTASQHTTVLVFLVLSLCIGCLIIFNFLFFRTAKKLFKKIVAETNEIGDASDIPLRDVFGAPAYVPTIKLKQMTAPFVFSDIGKLPVRYSPVRQNAGWDETVDPKEFSLVDSSFYPQVSDAHFRSMFSTTSFYEAKDVFSYLTYTDTRDSFDSGEDSEYDDGDGLEMTANRGGNTDNNHIISEEDFKTSSFMDTDSLPSAWERRITSDGRIFFVDHNEMKITHIAPPVVRTGSAASIQMCQEQSFRMPKASKR